MRVLVVDDSAFMRRAISQMLATDPDIQVVGAARNGKEGLELARQLQPDVITLDIEMPVMDGLGLHAGTHVGKPGSSGASYSRGIVFVCALAGSAEKYRQTSASVRPWTRTMVATTAGQPPRRQGTARAVAPTDPPR
jgi:CheY-like chemotaxis protein